MKINKLKVIISGVILVFILFTSVLIYAYSTGITGRTKKTTNEGCSCHNASPDPQVSVTFTGPDTVTAGQTVQYSLTVSKASKTGAGVDIATRLGTLAPVSNNIRLLNGELTHNFNIPMTNGSVTVQFTYTAPNSTGTDTLWANGNATNSNGFNNGDDWNWADSKRIIIRPPNAINIISTQVPDNFSLEQNYPNPFNPTTRIKFNIPKTGFVNLTLSDVTGREVQKLVNQNLTLGVYEYELDASSLPSGVYFYRIATEGFSQTKKMILVK